MLNENVCSTWGSITCAEDASVDIAVGLLRLNLARTQQDWTICYEYQDDRYWNGPDGWKNEWRTVVETSHAELLVKPAVPNRDIVARPAKDLYIPAGVTTTLYIGYPAWLLVLAEDGLKIADLATELMSETWLGPNSRVGTLAYATETQARLLIANMPSKQNLIRTPITIKNASAAEVNISRLSIPAPQLTLYEQEGVLWSSSVEVVCEALFSQASVDIKHAAPAHLSAPEQVADPRVQEETGSVTRAIGFLFS